jgi:hypothetical protein
MHKALLLLGATVVGSLFALAMPTPASDPDCQVKCIEVGQNYNSWCEEVPHPTCCVTSMVCCAQFCKLCVPKDFPCCAPAP